LYVVSNNKNNLFGSQRLQNLSQWWKT